MISPVALKTFFDRQIACWPQAAARYADLAKVDKRIIEIGGFPVIILCELSLLTLRSMLCLSRQDRAFSAERTVLRNRLCLTP